jgi:hypothetical protein
VFQSLNNNNAILKMIQIHCENLRLTPRNSAQLGLKSELDMKSDYGTKLECILIDMSLQIGKNVMNIISVADSVCEFFESFSGTQSWLDQIDININDALIKQNNRQNKVG